MLELPLIFTCISNSVEHHISRTDSFLELQSPNEDGFMTAVAYCTNFESATLLSNSVTAQVMSLGGATECYTSRQDSPASQLLEELGGCCVHSSMHFHTEAGQGRHQRLLAQLHPFQLPCAHRPALSASLSDVMLRHAAHLLYIDAFQLPCAHRPALSTRPSDAALSYAA